MKPIFLLRWICSSWRMMAIVFCAASLQRMESDLFGYCGKWQHSNCMSPHTIWRPGSQWAQPGGSVSLTSHYKGGSMDTCAVSSASMATVSRGLSTGVNIILAANCTILILSSSSSKSLLYVTFRHKRSFKLHYNTIKTL